MISVLAGFCPGQNSRAERIGRLTIKQERHEKRNDYFNDDVIEFLEQCDPGSQDDYRDRVFRNRWE